MAGRIPDDTLQAIRERVSIVEVISGYVSLKRAGRNHIGLCPFHAEKTPSFTVSDDRGLFHCFGCGAGGSVFTFLMRAEGVSFREAVEVLGKRAGVALPERGEQDGGRRKELIAINEVTQRYFRDALRSTAGTAARRYLTNRGVGEAIIERYGLGFCPPAGPGLVRALAAQRRSLRLASDLGLVGRRADGSTYERFRGRVTFPIRDRGGSIVGFGGRTLGDDQPKYLNSPESPLFRKGNVLYGLFEARQAIRDAGRVVIVEGYLDALALVEAGIAWAVASLGTALTEAQLSLVRPLAAEVIAFFDGDRAGEQAAQRAFAVCNRANVWGYGAFLPDGFDPDTFVRQRGVEATRALLERPEPLADFVLRGATAAGEGSMPQREAAAARFAEAIEPLRGKNPVRFDLLVRMAAERLQIGEATLRTLRAASPSRLQRREAPPPTDEPVPEEEMALVEAMALDRDAAALGQQSDVLGMFRSAELAEAARAVASAWAGSGGGHAAVDVLPRNLAERVAGRLLADAPGEEVDWVQVARDCIGRIERRTLRSQSRAVRDSLHAAETSGDDRRVREEIQRASDLLRRRTERHA